jgi:hypothetical protein
LKTGKDLEILVDSSSALSRVAALADIPEVAGQCIRMPLENGVDLEDVQRAAGRREPSTTKLYDRRGYNPEKSASFFATY